MFWFSSNYFIILKDPQHRQNVTLPNITTIRYEKVEWAITRQNLTVFPKVFSRHLDPSILHSWSQNPKTNEERETEKTRIFSFSSAAKFFRSIAGRYTVPPPWILSVHMLIHKHISLPKIDKNGTIILDNPTKKVQII